MNNLAHNISISDLTCKPTLALTWRDWLTFAFIVAIVCVLLVLKNIVDWNRIRRKGSTIELKEFFILKWQGLKPSRIAAAEWMAAQVEGGDKIQRSIWISFSRLGVDVLKLAASYVAASQAEMTTSIGILGAAALSGQDPLELVRNAHANGVNVIDTKYIESQILKNNDQATA